MANPQGKIGAVEPPTPPLHPFPKHLRKSHSLSRGFSFILEGPLQVALTLSACKDDLTEVTNRSSTLPGSASDFCTASCIKILVALQRYKVLQFALFLFESPVVLTFGSQKRDKLRYKSRLDNLGGRWLGCQAEDHSNPSERPSFLYPGGQRRT